MGTPGYREPDTEEARQLRRVKAEFAAQRIADTINARFGAHLTPGEVRGLICDNWRQLSHDAHRVHEGGPPDGLEK